MKTRPVRIYTFIIFFITTVIVPGCCCFAQKPAGTTVSSFKRNHTGLPARAENSVTFQSLPENFDYNGVRCILQDHKGYMWFGTLYGLIRYDGINLYLYENDPNDSSSLIYNSVNTLFEDKNHRLWIGTPRGLNLYNREKDNFIRFSNLNPNLNFTNRNYVTDLSADENSVLWITSFGNGLYSFDYNTKSIRNYPFNENDSISFNSNRLSAISIDKENNIWLGTQNGLILFSIKNRKFRHFYTEEDNPESLSNNNITTLTHDPEGNLWIGTRGGGLNKLIQKNGQYYFKRYISDTKSCGLSNNFILSLDADNRGYLWIGTENGGLNRLNISTDSIQVYQVEEGNDKSITGNSVWSVYSDREERIWIGTSHKGINVIDEKFNKFESYQKNIANNNGLTNNYVKGFAEDDKGNVWVAMDGGGICKFDPVTRQFSHKIRNTAENKYLTNNAVQCILYDSADNLWLGNWAGGIDRLNKEGTKIKNYKLEGKQGVGNNNVFVIYSDLKGKIWAGTAGSGLFRYDENKDEFVQILCDIPSTILNELSYVSSMLQDSDSTYWIGTLNGFVLLHEKNNGHFDCKEIANDENTSLSSSMIEVVFKDSRGRLWLGTGDYGLNLYNPEADTSMVFQKKDGLPSNIILGILEDDKGFLWITTNKGLSKFDYDKRNFINYTRDDGLNSNEFCTRAIFQTKKGEFYIGSEKGFNTFYPEQIRKNDFIPPVYLTSLKIHNVEAKTGEKGSPLKKHIAETEEIILNHTQSSFTIEFVALNYTRAVRNQFTYKLEGFDTKWNYAGNSRSASYTNIKPGKYVFMVKGSNNDGVWNNTPTRLMIRIKPPFWKTWWAISIYVLFILAVVLISLKIWNDQIHIKHQLKLEQLAREKEHELNERNIQFFTNISHEFRTPLSLITAPLESIIPLTKSKIKDQLVVVYRNAQRLLHLTNNLMDFRKLEEGITSLKVKNGNLVDFISDVSSYFNVRSKRRHIQFKVEASGSEISGWFDPEKLETILLNLLSNAFKYTSDYGKIYVAVNSLSLKKIEEIYNYHDDNISPETQYIEISVIDNGAGIKADELPLVFDKFYQSLTFKERSDSGTGIGLALTKGLVELHHGFIRAQSKPNSETRFTVVFPIGREAYTGDEIVTEPTNILKRTILDDAEGYEKQSDKKKVPQPVKDEEKADILIVEDNYELRTFLVSELGEHYNITQAEDGKQGIELAFRDIPDLIVSDVLMPKYSGIDLCRTVKTDIKTCHIPVILLTAKTTINDQIAGADIGADVYITKPFNMKLLVSKINQLIKSREKLYAHFSQDVYIMSNKLTDNEMDQMFLQKIIDYIIQNITDNTLNVEELASAMNLSRSNIYRKIKALTGKNIIEFIRIVRLKQAIKLMETKKYTLAEIAYQTGFTSPSYFAKSFKDQYGKPPSEFLS